jgi:hypothetical protein
VATEEDSSNDSSRCLLAVSVGNIRVCSKEHISSYNSSTWTFHHSCYSMPDARFYHQINDDITDGNGDNCRSQNTLSTRRQQEHAAAAAGSGWKWKTFRVGGHPLHATSRLLASATITRPTLDAATSLSLHFPATPGTTRL